jgi:hypothetical protein
VHATLGERVREPRFGQVTVERESNSCEVPARLRKPQSAGGVGEVKEARTLWSEFVHDLIKTFDLPTGEEMLVWVR